MASSGEFDLDTIDPRNHPSLESLALSTEAAFAIIRPWCQRQSELQSAALKGITSQSKKYADAIKFSINAARCSSTLAQEAINYADMRLSAGITTWETARRQYLSGMAAVASQGKEKTGQALREFRDVAGKVTMLIDDATKERKERGDLDVEAGVADLDELKDGIPHLEQFRNSIEIYVVWWGGVDIRQASTADRAKIDYDENRLKNLKEEWTKLQDDYRAYVCRIEILQGRHPELTADSLYVISGAGKETLTLLANIYEEEQPKLSMKDSIPFFSTDRMTPIIEQYLKALDSGFRWSRDAQDNAVKVISAIRTILNSDSQRSIDKKAVNLMNKEHKSSKKILDDFAQVRTAIHAILSKEPPKRKGSVEDKDFESKITSLSKFNEATLADYTWWTDIESRHSKLLMKADTSYEESHYKSLETEWTRLRQAYDVYEQQAKVIRLEYYPEIFIDFT